MGIATAHKPKPETSRNGKAFSGRAGKESFFTKDHTDNSFFSQVQAKSEPSTGALKVGQPGDKYEVEADAMADQVVQRLQGNEADHTPFFQSYNGNGVLQTKCDSCEEEVQAKELESADKKPELLQTKSSADDSQSSANSTRIATPDVVPLQPAHLPPLVQKSPTDQEELQTKEGEGPEEETVQLKCATCEGEDTQTKLEEPMPQTVQAKCADCGEDGQAKTIPGIQTKDGTISSPTSLSSQLNSSKGSGSSLPEPTRNQMESSFGADFSNVKVHTDSNAVSMNQSLNAQAFTHGSDVYFNEGKYDTNSNGGQHLLAHELTHTVQQNAVGDKVDGNEKEEVKTDGGNLGSSTRDENTDATTDDKNPDESLVEQTQSDRAVSLEDSANSDQVAENITADSTKEKPLDETTMNVGEGVRNGSGISSSNQSAVQGQVANGVAGGGGSGNNAGPPVLELNAESATGLLNSLSFASPTGFMQGMQEAKSLVPQIQQNENTELINSLPEITQPTGLPVTTAENPSPDILTETGEVDTPEVQNEGGPLQIEETHQQVEGHINVANIPTPRTNAEEDQSFTENIRNATTSLPTSDATINTSAGERPSVNLTGEANPQLNEEGQQLANENVSVQQSQANSNINNDFGENNIYPRYDELKQLRPELSERQPAGPSESQLESLPDTSPEVYASFDNQSQESVNAEVGAEMARHEAERERMNVDSENERVRGMAEIQQETERTRIEQEAIQSGAREEVAGHQQTWREENIAVRNEYSERSSARRTEIDSQIETEVTSAEEEVETELTNAEERAETERLNAESEASRQREEAEREQANQSFWDRVSSAVSSFFDKLKEALNTLFDGLRKLVADIIEAAKSVVNTLIDAARNLIVGLIEQFGEFLKGLVDIVLAAFPEIAERVKGWIDQAVDVAVNAVNALADALKEIANAILDAIGAVLDFILAAYQAFYNALLDVLEFLTGGLIKIIQFLAALVEGAWYAPGEFFGALAEEALGGNPADPLKDIEVPIGLEENWASAMGIGPEQSDGSEISQDQDNEMSIELHRVLTASELADDDVELEPDPAVELSPELIANLSTLQDGETMELGGAGADAVTTTQFQESVADDAGFSLEGQGENTIAQDAEQSTEVVDENLETPETDWRSMNDEAKLDHYNAQMLVESADVGNQEPTPGRVTPEPTIDNSPEALITKTGRLGVAQRLAFMGRQMMTGLQVFWNKNKVWIIAALVAALLAAGVIAFFTGGAGLALAVDIIIKAMIIIFGLYAVYQALGHIWDYVKKAWAGDAVGAGKSLAKAMAVIVMEFLIDKILLGMGKVYSKFLKAVKNTRIGRAVRRGLVVVRRGRRAVRRVVRRGISKIKGNRLVVSMRGVVGRGVKRFSTLRRRILDKFGFDKMWFKASGQYIELWASFNPKFILAKHPKEIIEADNRFNPANGAQWRRSGNGQYQVKLPGLRTRWRNAAIISPDQVPRWARGTEFEIHFNQRGRINSTYSGAMNTDDSIHHLITMENLSHPIAQKGVRGGFDINDASVNGKRVSTYSSQPRTNVDGHLTASKDGIHASHPNYTNAQSDILNRFGEEFGDNVTDAMAARFLESMSIRLDEAIDGLTEAQKIDELFRFGAHQRTGVLGLGDFYDSIIKLYNN